MIPRAIQQLFKNPRADALGGYTPTVVKSVTVAKSKAPEIDKDILCTDSANALRFVHYYGNRVFYRHEKKEWYIWTGKTWQPDKEKQITSLAFKTIMNIKVVEIPATNDSVVKKELYSWLIKSMGKGKLLSMLQLADSQLSPQSELDTHPYLLNVQNGTVDLSTGQLLEHNREHYLTALANVNYNPDAECPRWTSFLERAFAGNQELIRYLQKVIGYALTSDVSEKCFFIFWGPDGNNGKTLIVNVMRELLGGDYCTSVASETLMSRTPQFIRSDIARLKGYRFASTSETPKQYRFNEALIKLLTGGDAITARKLYENDIEFTPEMKLIITTNPMPIFNTNDKALMDRVVIIPFMVEIPMDERDGKLTAKLIAEEGEGILAWAVRGSVMRIEEGLGRPPGVQDELRQYKPVATVSDFIDTCCVSDDKASTKTSDLYDVFVKYHNLIEEDSTLISMKEFGNQLLSSGFISAHRNDGNYRIGIRLRTELHN